MDLYKPPQVMVVMKSIKLQSMEVGLGDVWTQYTWVTVFLFSIPEMFHLLIFTSHREACLFKGFSAQHTFFPFKLFSFSAEPCWASWHFVLPSLCDSLAHFVLSTLVQWLLPSPLTQSLFWLALKLNGWLMPAPSHLQRSKSICTIILTTTLQIRKIDYKY